MANNSTFTNPAHFNGWLTDNRISRLVNEALCPYDDGELYLQYGQSESIAFTDRRLRTANFNITQGFGLRTVCDELVGYAHSNTLTEKSLRNALSATNLQSHGKSGSWDVSPARTNCSLYDERNIIEGVEFQTKVDLIQKIDAYIREKDKRVQQVSVVLNASWDTIHILRPGGEHYHDNRPLVYLNIMVMLTEKNRIEQGMSGFGGRYKIDDLLKDENWKFHANEAIRQAEVCLQSVAAPAGDMDVVLGAGWPGVMLHEAVGHGLEGDAIRRKESVYAGMLGQQVAAKGVTVVDDGAIKERRGSLNLDDEGTPTGRTVLIEDGKLIGFMQDRLNARLMGVKPTGNGRRQSYAHTSIPRMTNTFMLNGEYDPEEIISSVKDGIYATNFDGGQVNPTTGNFVFGCTEAYRIRNGKVSEPVKGATLIGNGPQAMRRVSMIGNNLSLDSGIGSCGKFGQNIPVGVGQPTLRMDRMTIGGTA